MAKRYARSLAMWMAAAITSLLGAMPLAAQVTWSGAGGDADWSNGDNWVGNVAPTDGDSLLFTGSTQLTNNNDLSITVLEMIFDQNAGGFTLQGQELTFDVDAIIRNESAPFQTLELDLAFDGDATIHAQMGEFDLLGNFSLAPASTLTFFSEDQYIYVEGVISGDGGVTVDGEGTVELAADNTYTGDTLVMEDGALLLNGSVAGSTTVQGILGIGRNDSLGTELVVEGGQLVAVNDDRFIPDSVDLTIDGGVETFGFFNLEFAGDVNMVNNPELNIDNVLVLTGDISGDNFSKIGEGTLVLEGTVTSAGTTMLMEGLTVLDGTIDNNVENAAFLRGNGSIGGNLTNVAGGILQAGDSGVFTIDGDLDHQQGATIQIALDTEANPVTHDVIDVGGAVTLQNNSAITMIHQGDGFIGQGTQATIITSGDGVTDQGAQINSTSPFVNWFGSVVGDDYVVTAMLTGTFVAAANTPNNKAVARGLEEGLSGPGGDALLGALQGATSIGAFNNALTQLNPQAYAAAPTMSVQTSSSFNTQLARTVSSLHHGQSRDTFRQSSRAARRTAAAQQPVSVTGSMNAAQYNPPGAPERMHFFLSGFGVFNQVDPGVDRTGYRGDSTGVMLGASYRLYENLLAGLVFGYASTDIRLDAGRGGGDIDTFRVGPYISYFMNQWNVDAALTYGFHSHDMQRNINALGLSRTADADYDAHDLNLFISTSYDFELTWQTTLSPVASLQYILFSQDSFTETGAGAANLRVDSETLHSLRTVLGGRLTHRIDMPTFTLMPELFLGWAHEFLDDDKDFGAQFAAGSTPFTVTAQGPGRDSFLLGAGVNAMFGPHVSGFFRYDGDFRSNADTHTVHGGVSLSF